MRSACICHSLGVPISHLPSTPSTWFCSPEIDNFVYRLRFLLWFFQTRLQARIEPCHVSTCIFYLLELINMKSECVPGCHVYHKNCSLGHSLWSMLPTWLTFSGSFSIKPSFMLLHAKCIHHSCVPFHFASPFCTSCLFFESFAVSHLGDIIISVLLIFITCLLPHFQQYISVSQARLCLFPFMPILIFIIHMPLNLDIMSCNAKNCLTLVNSLTIEVNGNCNFCRTNQCCWIFTKPRVIV